MGASKKKRGQQRKAKKDLTLTEYDDESVTIEPKEHILHHIQGGSQLFPIHWPIITWPILH